MSTVVKSAGHVHCKFVSEKDGVIVFKGIEDEVTYVVPRECLKESVINPETVYSVSYRERHKTVREDGAVCFERCEVISRERFMSKVIGPGPNGR